MEIQSLIEDIDETGSFQDTVKLILLLKKNNFRLSDLTIEHCFNLL